MIITPTRKHIRQANRQAKKLGGEVKVYEKHITLLNTNGGVMGYFVSREDIFGRAFLTYDKSQEV